MKKFSTKLVILGLLFQIYPITSGKSKSQSAPIIDGYWAALGQFPWHVMLRLNERLGDIGGGSIIGKRWVLTAAHCFIGHNYVQLVFGTIERLTNNQTIMISTDVFVHPQFDTISFRNDIALIKLPQELRYSNYIQPIPLISATYITNSFVGADAIITGFGDTRYGILSDWLLWGSLEIVNNSVCDRVYTTPMSDKEMCAIGYRGSDMAPCYGDSGGAVVWKSGNNQWVQIGIISFSKQECAKYPTGHTRITSFLSYIRSTTGLNV